VKGIIVALLPNEQYTARRPVAVNPHLTVLYFGSTDSEDFNPKPLDEYWAMLQRVWGHQIRANVTGESVFDGHADGFAMVDLINAPFLPEFYTVALETAQLFGLDADKAFGLLPHITTRYVKGVQSVEVVHRKVNIPFAFQRLGLWVGDDHKEVALT
jgi:hypothetical protein